jgi:hypothetical protein
MWETVRQQLAGWVLGVAVLTKREAPTAGAGIGWRRRTADNIGQVKLPPDPDPVKQTGSNPVRTRFTRAA